MKKLFLLLTIAASVMIIACEPAEECEDYEGLTCENGKKLQVCCDEGSTSMADCRYKYDGKTYECDADCEEAAAEAVAACMGTETGDIEGLLMSVEKLQKTEM